MSLKPDSPTKPGNDLLKKKALQMPEDLRIESIAAALDVLGSGDSQADTIIKAAVFLENNAGQVTQNKEQTTEVLQALIGIVQRDGVQPEAKERAFKAGRAILLAGWNRKQSRTRRAGYSLLDRWRRFRSNKEKLQSGRLMMLTPFLNVMGVEQEDTGEYWAYKREIAAELGSKAEDIAGYDDMIEQSMEALIQRINSDDLESVRRSACEALSKLWDAGWATEDKQESKRQMILDLVLETLKRENKGHNTWFVRQASATWLESKATDIANDDRMLDKTLEALIIQANDRDEKIDARRSAREASMAIWEAGWNSKVNRETRRPEVLRKVIEALNEEEDDPQDWQFRQSAIAWLRAKAADLVQNESMTSKSLAALVERTIEDSDEYIRRSAGEAIKEIWNVGWESGEKIEGRREFFLDLIIDTLRIEGKAACLVRQGAAMWLGTKAKSIAADERMMTDALNVLLAQVDREEEFSVLRSIMTASDKLWDEGWEPHGGFGDVVRARSKIQRAGLESKETRRAAVFGQVLKALNNNEWEFRMMAANWLDKNASAVSESDQMVNDALRARSRRANVSRETYPEVRRTARETSNRIWNGAWNREGQQQNVVDQVLKVVEDRLPGQEGLEFQMTAVNWLGDKERARGIAEVYVLAEKVANVLAILKRNSQVKEELRESAGRSLTKLWEELRKIKANEQKQLKDELESHDEERKDKVVRKLANENTLGARDNVSFLVDYWVTWIREEKEPRLVEFTADKIRNNDHAVLPLVDHFATMPEEAVLEESESHKTRRARRRIAKQLADMSDPRFFEEPEKRQSILDEIKEYAVPVFVRLLPEEKDVDTLQNMARMLAYSREREAVNALAKEVVGETREQKGRQELLATYYLEPSKAQNEQAAQILEDAVRQARHTLRLLRWLNGLVVLIGLLVILVGLAASMLGDETASRLPGLLAALGGSAAVVYQLVRRPMQKIQEANSNLVQMETAFTSFIWELNLNGTFIQSAYVKNGRLRDVEIDSTLGRIERAMRMTMDLVSVYTKIGKQRLVTRINKLEPAAGPSQVDLTIFGQHLLGDSRGSGPNGLGQNAAARVRNIAGTAAPETLQATGATVGARSGSEKITNATRKNGQKIPGLVAIDHKPINMTESAVSWEAETIRLKLPGSITEGTIWISLFVDGMETNALPFQVLPQPATEGAQNGQ